jgi:hypothetical protein
MTDSDRVMTAVDKLSPAMRALVHDFGFVIVRDMINDGYRDPAELRPLLDGWRARRQTELLNDARR